MICKSFIFYPLSTGHRTWASEWFGFFTNVFTTGTLTISVLFDGSFEASVVMILSKVIPFDNDRTTQYSTKTKNTL